ncbi:MAG: hypothetical protein O7E51_11285 [Acidobacteria bacterium]|nr:hypothetical protein [Acidobacteriota bacterium]
MRNIKPKKHFWEHIFFTVLFEITDDYRTTAVEGLLARTIQEQTDPLNFEISFPG